MNKKKIIFSSILRTLSIGLIFVLILMPIVAEGSNAIGTVELITNVGKWVYMEEYLFGIAGLIAIICLPLLAVSAELCVLSDTGVIKCKKLDTALYIINIVLSALLVGAGVNYFLGLGRTLGLSGLQLFKGPTYFNFATAHFYIYIVVAVGMLVLSILNRKSKKTK